MAEQQNDKESADSKGGSYLPWAVGMKQQKRLPFSGLLYGYPRPRPLIALAALAAEFIGIIGGSLAAHPIPKDPRIISIPFVLCLAFCTGSFLLTLVILPIETVRYIFWRIKPPALRDAPEGVPDPIPADIQLADLIFDDWGRDLAEFRRRTGLKQASAHEFEFELEAALLLAMLALWKHGQTPTPGFLSKAQFLLKNQRYDQYFLTRWGELLADRIIEYSPLIAAGNEQETARDFLKRVSPQLPSTISLSDALLNVTNEIRRRLGRKNKGSDP